jgi:hypothetical protein
MQSSIRTPLYGIAIWFIFVSLVVTSAEILLSRFARRMSPLGEVGRTLTAVMTAWAGALALPAGTGVEIYPAVCWAVWAATYLALTWVLILRSSPRQTRQWVPRGPAGQRG